MLKFWWLRRNFFFKSLEVSSLSLISTTFNAMCNCNVVSDSLVKSMHTETRWYSPHETMLWNSFIALFKWFVEDVLQLVGDDDSTIKNLLYPISIK